MNAAARMGGGMQHMARDQNLMRWMQNIVQIWLNRTRHTHTHSRERDETLNGKRN